VSLGADIYISGGVSPLLAACGRDQPAWMGRASRPLYNLYCEGLLWFMVLLCVCRSTGWCRCWW